MPKCKTAEDYHALAKERGFQWIADELPLNTLTSTHWQCNRGHQWLTHYSSIQQGSGCPFCVGNAPKAIEDYHSLAHERGFRWIGNDLPLNTHTRTLWQCAQWHQWHAHYGHIRQGSGCPLCHLGSTIKAAVDYHTLARTRGFLWIGDGLPPNIHTHTLWQCDYGHQWLTSYRNIRCGGGCHFCANKVPKIAEDYFALGRERGLQWIEDEPPPNIHIHTLWQCDHGHQWYATYTHIRQGRGCPFCVGNATKAIEDYHSLAHERGFRWIGNDLPLNTHTRTLWQCAQGHQWHATYHNIRNGTSCPQCMDLVNGHHVSQNQKALYHMLSGDLNHPCGPYFIDVALHRQGINIAIEYDAWFWHAGKEDHDTKRDRDLIAAGWRILRIRSNAQLPAPQRIESAITQLMAGEAYAEIVLNDWGSGPTFAEILAQSEVDSDWTQLDLWGIAGEDTA